MVTTNQTVRQCKEALAQYYGKRLKGVILYGSMARGQDTSASDIDLLVLLNPPLDYFAKNSGVIALIHQNFVKAGKLDKMQGKNLNWLFELRSVGDYGVSVHVASGEALRAVQVTERFLESIKQMLR
jgi:predicted nucleotidyltransferase